MPLTPFHSELEKFLYLCVQRMYSFPRQSIISVSKEKELSIVYFNRSQLLSCTPCPCLPLVMWEWLCGCYLASSITILSPRTWLVPVPHSVPSYCHLRNVMMCYLELAECACGGNWSRPRKGWLALVGPCHTFLGIKYAAYPSVSLPLSLCLCLCVFLSLFLCVSVCVSLCLSVSPPPHPLSISRAAWNQERHACGSLLQGL